VDVLDASCGGIGGCPFAPRATGNIATEDLVYMLQRGGFSTGLDLDALIRTAEWLEGPLGKRVPSGLRGAGRFPG
jgi:hydroxymethylglutaryl-CoA lyase